MNREGEAATICTIAQSSNILSTGSWLWAYVVGSRFRFFWPPVSSQGYFTI